MLTDVELSLLDNGTIPIFGEIDDRMAEDVYSKYLYLLKKREVEEIEFVINSCGGSTISTFAIIDVMKDSPKLVKTFAVGAAMSGAFFILIAGHIRAAMPSSDLMCHSFNMYKEGGRSELIATRKFEDNLYDKIVKHVIHNSNFKTKKEVETKLIKSDESTFLTPKEALKFGLIDSILEVNSYDEINEMRRAIRRKKG